MAERPILFSAPMVRAILDGSKNQTRRIVKPDPGPYWNPVVGLYNPTVIKNGGYEAPGPEIFGASDETQGRKCSYGQPGDRLWVRETFLHIDDEDDKFDGMGSQTYYAASGDLEANTKWLRERGLKWKPSIHMPRWASRILLEITGVRVERLQAISEADAVAEGIEKWGEPHPHGVASAGTARRMRSALAAATTSRTLVSLVGRSRIRARPIAGSGHPSTGPAVGKPTHGSGWSNSSR